jgi:hypothetical protein
MHAMPVQRGRLGQPVSHAHRNGVAAGGAQRGAQVRPVDPPRLGRGARNELRPPRPQGEIEDLAAAGVDARLEQRRGPESLIEPQAPRRVDVGARPHRPRRRSDDRYDAGGGHE